MNVAIIGCGGIGGYHLSHLKTFGDIAKVTGFCDLIRERAEAYSKEVESLKQKTNPVSKKEHSK